MNGKTTAESGGGKGGGGQAVCGWGGSLGRDGMDEMNVEGMGRVGEDVMKGEMEGKGRCEARKKRQEGGRGELKGKCTKYITNLSPLAPCPPPPPSHTLLSQKSQRGGRDLIRLSAVHHTHREGDYRLHRLVVVGWVLLGEAGREGRNEIELIGAVKCSNTQGQEGQSHAHILYMQHD